MLLTWEEAMFGARKIIEVSTNLAILVVCFLLCWTLITHKTFNLRSIFGGGMKKPAWKAALCRLPLVTGGATTRRLSS